MHPLSPPPARDGSPIERPNRKTVTEWVVARLYGMIFGGDIVAGEQLGEAELTQRLGVSRTPVREALSQLERDGIVNVSPVSGRRVVAAFGASDIREIYTIRAALEGLSHAEAATRITPDGIAALSALQAEMDSAERNTVEGRERQFDVDFRFHEMVSRIAELPRLSRELTPLWRQTRLLLRQLDRSGIYPRDDELIAPRIDHRAMLDALSASDAELAASAARCHIEARRDALLAAVEQRHGLS